MAWRRVMGKMSKLMKNSQHEHNTMGSSTVFRKHLLSQDKLQESEARRTNLAKQCTELHEALTAAIIANDQSLARRLHSRYKNVQRSLEISDALILYITNVTDSIEAAKQEGELIGMISQLMNDSAKVFGDYNEAKISQIMQTMAQHETARETISETLTLATTRSSMLDQHKSDQEDFNKMRAEVSNQLAFEQLLEIPTSINWAGSNVPASRAMNHGQSARARIDLCN